MTISVIVPVYNSADYLQACVQSILAQTFQGLELILIDDGSTDRSPKICDEFATQDERVKVIHQQNGGISRAQNAGLDAMTGEHVTFVDNDDIISPTMLERLVAILEENEAQMSTCRWSHIGASDVKHISSSSSANTASKTPTIETFTNPVQKYQTVFPKTFRRLFDKELHYFNEANWAKLYKADLFDGIRFPEDQFAQDAYISVEIFRKVDKVAATDEVLYFWVQHDESVTHSTKDFSYYHDSFLAAQHNIEQCEKLEVIPYRSLYQARVTVNDERNAVREAENPASSANAPHTPLDSYGQTTALRSVHYPLNDTEGTHTQALDLSGSVDRGLAHKTPATSNRRPTGGDSYVEIVAPNGSTKSPLNDKQPSRVTQSGEDQSPNPWSLVQGHERSEFHLTDQLKSDLAYLNSHLQKLSFLQRIKLFVLTTTRKFENLIYDIVIHDKR